MTQYLIFPTEQEALDRSKEGHVTDTLVKMRKKQPKLSKAEVADKVATEFVTQYRWAIDVGADGQTALVIDGDEQLLTPEETAALISDLPDGEGENWYKPPPEMPVE
jgi:hypothetical protein